MSFVFFDTETTGLSRTFDQIVHFAAVRTDNDLNEVECFDVRSHLNAHSIPHPEALCVSRRRISELTDQRLMSHYEMMRIIRAKLLDWSPSIFAGYNSLRFDEELLRQAFFQTLHPPYLTSLHQNGRTDVMSLVLAASAIAKDAISIPADANGRHLFRLANLAKENGIDHQAHDPLSDARASIALARLVRMAAPAAWERFVRFSRKATVIDFMDNEAAFLLTEFFSNQAFHTPVVCIGADSAQPTLRFCLALTSQTRDFLRQPDSTIQELLTQKPCPIRRVRVNAAPVMTPLYDIDDADLTTGLSVDEVETLAHEIKSDASGCSRLSRIFNSMATPFPPAVHVEQNIYQGFSSNSDMALMEAFHAAPWNDRLAIVNRLDDQRAKELGLRLIYLEAPECLPSALVAEIEGKLLARINGSDDEPRGFPHALMKVDEMLPWSTEAELETLTEYRSYLAGRLSSSRPLTHAFA